MARSFRGERLRVPQRRLVYSAATLAGVLLAVGAEGELPTPKLTGLNPAGAKRGTTVEVTVAGLDLDGFSGALVSRPEIQVAPGAAGKLKLTIPADTPTGLIDVRVVSPLGVSNPRSFHLCDLENKAEAEPNNFAEQANPAMLDGIVDGRADARADVDYFKFSLKKGQRVQIDCLAERVDSRLDGVLTLFDSSGAIAISRNYFGRDPFIDFTAPSDGDYMVRVHDLLYNGGADYFYRLAIHTGPTWEYAYPPCAAPGATVPLAIYGRNLPGGAVDAAAVVEGQKLESITRNFAAAPDPTGDLNPGASLFRPFIAATIRGYELASPAPGGVGFPLFVGLAEFPVALEKEPNDQPASAQVFAAPAELVGRCDRPGDTDWYRFSGKKGASVKIESISERIGHGADLVALLRRVLPPAKDAPANTINAQDVAEFDDFASHHDAVFFGALPEDGDYLLQVRDRYGETRGSARFVYRLKVGPATPDFRLAVAPADENNPSAVNFRQGGTGYVHVFAVREAGFNEPITIEVVNPPAGVTAPATVIAPGQTVAPLVLVADPKAPTYSGPLSVKGTATLGGKPVVRTAQSFDVIWPTAGAAPKPARLARALVGACRDNAPYRLTVEPNKFVVGQGSQVGLPLKLERRWPEFTAALEGVTALHLPANVDNAAVTIAASAKEGYLALYVKPNAPPGAYTIVVRGSGKVPFTKTPQDPKAKKADVVVADVSPPITLTIAPRPVELASTPNPPTIKVGATADVKVTIKRHNNFKGPVALTLTAPPGVTGISATPVTAPPEAGEAVMKIAVAAGTPPGDKPLFTIRGAADVGGQSITVDDRLTVKVVP